MGDVEQVEFLSRMPKEELDVLTQGDVVAVEVGESGEEEVRMGLLDAKHEQYLRSGCLPVGAAAPSPRQLWYQIPH